MNIRIVFSIVSFISCFPSFSQKNESNSSETTYRKCSAFSKTLPLRDLFKQQQASGKKEKEFESKNKFTLHNKVNFNSQPIGEDPVLQRTSGTSSTVPILKSWDGDDGMQPPDPSGAAGPNHYVQTVNIGYTVYDKEGAVLLGPLSLTSIWPGTYDLGDAVVMYDKFADRWVITEPEIDYNYENAAILIAVSETSDPMGAYYTYRFDYEGLPDYPKYSIWWDAYYLGLNSEGNNALALDRTRMLAGDPTAGMIEKHFPGLSAEVFLCPLPADADGQLPLAGTPMYFFNFEDDYWSTQDVIKIYKMVPNWNTPAGSTLVLYQTLTPAPFDTDFGYTWENVEQPGTTQKLDVMAGVFMYRAPYRKWVNYNSVLLNHAVDVDNTDHAGIRWYELRESAGVWSIYQQGTYAPDGNSRWMASMAMDDDGNIGMAYSVSGPTVMPGLRFTGRYANDPLGVMSVAEETAQEGTGVQEYMERYGDYSQMSLDPDGYTFWYTGEYVSEFSQKTKIFSYKLQGTQGISEKSNSAVAMKAYKIDSKYVTVEVSGLTGSENVVVDLFDVTGKMLQHNMAAVQAGMVKMNINCESIPQGAYIVRSGNNSFQRVVKIIL